MPQWTLDGQTARLRAGNSAATVRVDQPGLGVHDVRRGDREVPTARLLGVLRTADALPGQRWDDCLDDVYIRGRDLVATFRETSDRPLRYQLYWRALDGDEFGELSESAGSDANGGAAVDDAWGVELVVSVQTSVLDILPTAWVRTDIAVDRAARFAAGAFEFLSELAPSAASATTRSTAGECILCRLTDGPDARLSYIELTHSGDVTSSEAYFDLSTGSRRAIIRHQLFPMRLEKGVILRTRLRGWFAPGGATESMALETRRQFEDSPLPLTT